MRKFTAKMPRPRMSPERGHTFCAFLRKTAQSKPMSRFHRSHFIQKFTGKMPRPSTTAQTLWRACAVKTHVKISQEPLYTEIDRKNAAAQIEPGLQTHTLCEPAQAKRMSRFHQSHFTRKFTGKMPRPRLRPERRHTFCASLRRRNACQDFTGATLFRKKMGKMPRPRLSPERRHTFCASLRSRSACPHVTKDIRRATLHGNLQEKCRNPE